MPRDAAQDDADLLHLRRSSVVHRVELLGRSLGIALTEWRLLDG
ncbi:hypothetical protein [Actinocorallia populi]|nr:hypothetical protein [Actinocorallia populi]